MKVSLVYDKQRIINNETFIRRVSGGLQSRNIDVETILDCNINQINSDIAVMRTYSTSCIGILNNKKIRQMNNNFVQEIGNDKAKAYDFVKKIGVPILDYKSIKSNDDSLYMYPFILKTIDGHGGNEVFLIKSEDEYNTCIIKYSNKKFIIQKCADFGWDKRIYIIGNKIIAAMQRINKNDFRSNYKLGGQAFETIITEEEKFYVNTIISKIKPDFIGIDFIKKDNHIYFNEIEDIVGSRMIYENTDIDILDQYAEYIKNTLISRRNYGNN